MHIENVMYVVLGWVCQIKTKFSEAKLRAGLIEWFARPAWYLNFWALWKPNNGCCGERMFLTCGKTSNFNNKPTSGNTDPCAIHTKWRKHYVPPEHLVSPLVCRGPWMSTVVLYCWCHSDSASFLLYFTLGKHIYSPWQMTFLIVYILSVFNASYCIFVQRKKYLRWTEIKIFFQNGSATRKSQVGWPLTFLPQRAIRGFFLPYPFQIWSKKLKYSTLPELLL